MRGVKDDDANQIKATEQTNGSGGSDFAHFDLFTNHGTAAVDNEHQGALGHLLLLRGVEIDGENFS